MSVINTGKAIAFRNRPIVLIMCSHSNFELPGIGALLHQNVFERYVEMVDNVIGCSPLLLPALKDYSDNLADYIQLADGILLTGDASNICPVLYGEVNLQDPCRLDIYRDARVLPFIRAAIASGVPLFGICRGIQEINVALGGTLYQSVHKVPGRTNHRSRRDRSFAERYLPSHRLNIERTGWFAKTLTERGIPLDNLQVNSLHEQAINILGQSVVIEATADDGTIEAIRVANTQALAIGVQWHPEWYSKETPLYAAILDEFRKACFAHLESRTSRVL